MTPAEYGLFLNALCSIKTCYDMERTCIDDTDVI